MDGGEGMMLLHNFIAFLKQKLGEQKQLPKMGSAATACSFLAASKLSNDDLDKYKKLT